MKKTLAIVIAILLIALLVGCSNNNSSTVSEYVAPKESAQQHMTERVTEAPTETPTEGIGERLTNYEPLNSFNNGYIWIEYDKEFKGLMNESGKIVYSTDKDARTNPISEDGYTFYSVTKDKHNVNTIIDKEGKETFTLQNTDDEVYNILAQGDGTFLVSHKQSGFSDIKYSIYTIDPNGKMIGTKKEVESQPVSATYKGNKMFLVSFKNLWDIEYKVFNCNNDSFYLLNGLRKTMNSYPFYNGTGYLCNYIWNESEPSYQYFYGSISYDDISSEESWENWMSNHSVDKNSYKSHNDLKYIQEGFRLNERNKNEICFLGYDDKQIKLPSFPETTSIKEIGDFSGGYLPIFLQGADEKNYVTVVDTSGKQMYEPVKISDSTWISNFKCYCSNGEVFIFISENKEYFIVDISGNKKQLSIDPSGSIEGYDGDYVYHSGGIWSLKDNSELTAYFPINSNSYSNKSDESSDVSSAKQKNYVNKNDFSIIGKWKNVGDYTYGQAQKGSIVAFDGKNCNFFSPMDTYAFYKNGDNYKLDCTSPLADTVSFTVKIVDENNIDVFNGSNIVELKRVN